MPTTLTAVQVPPIIVWAAVLDPATSSPLTSEALVAGDTTAVRTKLNENAVRLDLRGRFGGGCYGVEEGLALSAGAGLTLNIATGTAIIDGDVKVGTGVTHTVTDAVRNHIWVSQAGVIVHTTNLTPPAGAHAYIGSALAAAGAISSVDTSGVLYLRGSTPWRRTADVTLPGDTPPAKLLFLTVGTVRAWLWDGERYWEVSAGAAATPVPIADGGTGAATAPDALVNLNAQSRAHLDKAITISTTLSASEAENGSIRLTDGGGLAASWTVTFPANVDDGQACLVRNDTGKPGRLTRTGGSRFVYLNEGQAARVYVFGGELYVRGREITRNPSNATFVVSNPTDSYSQWEEVEGDYIELVPSGGDVLLDWPSAGALGNTGRMQGLRNEHTTSGLTLQTSGAATRPDYQTVLLPGETQHFVINESGILNRSSTRAYTPRGAVSITSDANHTVAHPDFLGFVLHVTSTVTLTATRNLVLPTSAQKMWVVRNATTGGQTLIVKTSGGTGVAVRHGKTIIVECDGTNMVRADGLVSIDGSTDETAATTAATATVANTGTETTLLATVIGSATLPAALLTPGRMIRLTARGLLSTDAVPGTLNIRFKLGATTIVTTGDQTPTAALTDRLWEASVILTCRTIGAAGTVIAQGIFTHFPTAQTVAAVMWEMLSTTTTVVDTTGTLAIDLTADWQTADPQNDIRSTNVLIEALN